MASMILHLLLFLFFLSYKASSSSSSVQIGSRSILRSLDVPDLPDAAVDLNLTSFDQVLRDTPASYAIVEFFAHWCPACRNYKPQYEKVARLFNGPEAVHPGIVFMARVDCAVKINTKLCDRFSVSHYPMLLWGPPSKFSSGSWEAKKENEIHAIDDGRTADRLLNWINKQMGSTYSFDDEKYENEHLSTNVSDYKQIMRAVYDVEEATSSAFDIILEHKMINSVTRVPLIGFLQLLVAHHPSKRCRKGSAEILINFDEFWPSDLLSINKQEDNVSRGKNALQSFRVCGKEVPRGYWVGNWYDGTDTIPSEGRQIEWLWRVNKEGEKDSFYDFSLLSSAKIFKDPNSMHASRIQKGRVYKASASSLTKSSEQRDVSHGTGELPACSPPDPETSPSPVLVEHKNLSSQNGPLLNGMALDFSDKLQAEFNSVIDLKSLFNDSLAPNRSSLFPALQSVTKRKGSYSDAMVSKRRKDAHPSEPKGVEDVPPDPFGDGTPLDTSVRSDNDVDAPQGPNKAATPDLNIAHAPLSPEIVGSSIPAQKLTSVGEENSIFSPRFSFDGGSPILSSMSGIQSVDVAAAIMQNISLPTDGEAHVLDGLHDRNNISHALYLVNVACQGNASCVKKLHAELNKEKKDKEVLNEEVAKLMKEKDALQSSHDELYALLDTYETLLNEKAALQTVYDGLAASSTENENRLMSTNADLECKIRSLTDQCSSLQQEVKNAERHSNLRSVRINSLEKELVHLKSGFERDKLAMESKHKREMDDTSECYAKRIQAIEDAHVHALNKQRTELETDCQRLVREEKQNTLDNTRRLVANMILSKSYEELKSIAEKLKSKGNAKDPPEG